jgi:D-alanine--poly(phosphoribitol) ligase subunit 1
MQINVLEYFLRTCDRLPSKMAVVDDHEGWTFEKLRERAGSIGCEIMSRTLSTNRPIATYLPKKNDAVAAFLAALLSGNCYAPLDVKAPLPRIQAIVDRLDPVLLLTTKELGEQLASSGVDRSRFVFLDEIADAAPSLPDRWLRIIDTDPVYIIHTSGSTGNPKGVVISHRAVIDYIDWARDCFQIDEHCVIGNQAPFIFDNSTLDLYICFACGATLHLIPEDLFLFPLRLLEYLASRAINFIFWVPSLMVIIADKCVLEKVPGLGLKKILFAGEVMPAKHLNAWRSRFSDALFANLYGPTEITVDCTYYIVDRDLRDDEPVPIGRTCRNSEVLILNERNEPCQKEERGELCVRGSSLALGYWNQPAQTAAAFVQNPLNHHYPELIYRTGDLVYRNEREEIIFVGRKDFQIKHMGYRIELGDIEHFALQVPGIRHGCVLYHQEKKEIIFVYEADAEVDQGNIRSELGRNLPKYMWPTVFRRVAELPRTPSGKIDRQELMVEFTERVEKAVASETSSGSTYSPAEARI